MENFDKMIMIPYKDFSDIIKNILKLANQSAFNEELELKVNNEYIKDTNIIDYLMNKKDLKYMKEYEKYLNINNLYTKKSPIDYKLRNNKKRHNWIQI